MTVKIVVNGQSLSWYDRSPKIAANSIEFVEFQFLLSEDWDGHVVVAQFSQKGQTYNKVLVNNCCKLPVEIEDGKCYVSIFGQVPNGPSRATVIPLIADISLSGFVSDAKNPIPPTPDLYSQLIEYFSSLVGSGGSGNGASGVYVLAEGETLEEVPEDVVVVIDPFGEADTASGYLLVDRTTGVKYTLYVDNGKLKMEKGE